MLTGNSDGSNEDFELFGKGTNLREVNRICSLLDYKKKLGTRIHIQTQRLIT